MNRCPFCGLKVETMQLHSFRECESQQTQNNINRGFRPLCDWCHASTVMNGKVTHKSNCPIDE